MTSMIAVNSLFDRYLKKLNVFIWTNYMVYLQLKCPIMANRRSGPAVFRAKCLVVRANLLQNELFHRNLGNCPDFCRTTPNGAVKSASRILAFTLDLKLYDIDSNLYKKYLLRQLQSRVLELRSLWKTLVLSMLEVSDQRRPGHLIGQNRTLSIQE